LQAALQPSTLRGLARYAEATLTRWLHKRRPSLTRCPLPPLPARPMQVVVEDDEFPPDSLSRSRRDKCLWRSMAERGAWLAAVEVGGAAWLVAGEWRGAGRAQCSSPRVLCCVAVKVLLFASTSFVHFFSSIFWQNLPKKMLLENGGRWWLCGYCKGQMMSAARGASHDATTSVNGPRIQAAMAISHWW